jgi:2-polyprenyl-3-methyl-5-hydroxy-6-metoxy-1,4-benzoquinol methylase
MPLTCSLTNSPLHEFIKVEDHFLSHELFTIHSNEDASLLTTFPVPENLDIYYESSDYISHNPEARGLVPLLYSAAQRYSLWSKSRLVQKHVRFGSSLLDYGSGAGKFLQYMKSKRWQVAGVEPNTSARNSSLKNSDLIVYSLGEFLASTEKFSIVTLWHVLEHIPNYNDVIIQLKDRIEDKGVLVIAVPNFNSWDARHYKSNWAAYDVPRHLFHWSRKGITHLAKRHNLKLVEIKGMWFDAFYISILSEKYRGSNWPLINGLIKGLWSNLSAIFTGETSSLIYVLKKD